MALDGVPKEGLRIHDVLVRIAVLLLIREKVSSSDLLSFCISAYYHLFILLCVTNNDFMFMRVGPFIRVFFFSTFVLIIMCSSVFAVNFLEDDVGFPPLGCGMTGEVCIRTWSWNFALHR